MFAYRSHLPALPILLLVLIALPALALLHMLPGMDRLMDGHADNYRLMAEEMITGNIQPALQLVSWLSAGAAIWLFDRNLSLASSGARPQSRFLYAGVLLFLAPVFLQSGLAALPGMPALALLLAHIYLSGKAMDNRGGLHGIGAFFLAGLAMAVQPALWPVLIVFLFEAVRETLRAGRFAVLIGMLPALIVALWPFVWVSDQGWNFLTEVSGIRQWSFSNWVQSEVDMPVHTGLPHSVASEWPKWLYLLFPLFHPAFCLVLPGLLLVLKRTDWQLPFRRTLLISLGLYLFYLAGLPFQSMQLLLPAYTILLILLFQAWDRFQAYGEFFLPRLAYGIIAVAAAVQLLANIFYALPLR